MDSTEWFYPLIWLFRYFTGVPVDVGSHNHLFAATSKVPREDEGKWKGGFLFPVGKLTTSKETQDEGLARDCWETTERVAKEM